MTRRTLQEPSKASMLATQKAQATFRNAGVVHAMGMLEALVERWGLHHRKALELQARASDHAGAIIAFTKFFRILLQTVILGAGAYLAVEHEISAGMMIAASIIIGREKKLIPVARLYATEIERERLQGVIGASIAQIAKSNGEIGEYKIQIQQLQQKFEEEVAKSLADVRDKIVEFRAKLDVAKDVLRRVDVLAPVSGTAQNLKVFTIGQVVKGGRAPRRHRAGQRAPYLSLIHI